MYVYACVRPVFTDPLLHQQPRLLRLAKRKAALCTGTDARARERGPGVPMGKRCNNLQLVCPLPFDR